MYESIRIQNFRGLKDLTIENLGRVNLLVGANNVGKTSVLEAISLLHMHQDSYEMRQILANRGFADDSSLSGATRTMFGTGPGPGFTVTGNTVRDSVQLMGWRSGRRPSDRDRGQRLGRIQVAFTPRRGEELSMEDIYLDYSEPRERPFDDERWPAGNGFVQIRFNEDVRLPKAYARGYLGEHAAFWTGYRLPRLVAADLVGLPRGESDPLVVALRTFDDRVRQMTTSYDSGRQEPVVVVGMEDGSYVQLDVIGEGSRRLLEFVLLLPQAAGGTAVIDEVESGIYYENLAALWELTDGLSQMNRIQVFATTHSLECVEAAVRAFDGLHAGDFRLHRLSRRNDEIRVTTYDHEAAEATLNVGVEFR